MYKYIRFANMEANNTNKHDLMREELDLLKHVPDIIKAQKLIGDRSTPEGKFFFGLCRMRRAWAFEAVAATLALLLDAALIAAAVAFTIFMYNLFG